ncbi:3-phosphoshikimate 1-carboxyvinyltransferase [Aequorivita todarodis]|uniref:3-phosphoshikimate 1-carboxyvinyltransferase n=1 Tax=Aequorivita todarodis TaxID=2036821 RepID=UPI002350355A|nr:3-phosphoshikimate 1-carboxyvinyltransferase [Aequorivita todarodis]MDC8001046.1 3-phosphoshikimate 1-carboxyvinyltransferase [Aequorivita todarodis]
MKAILERRSSLNKNVKINISGSKSESNRMLILQAQFPNISIENLSESDDTVVLQKGLQITNGTVDVHHAGTAMRFLTAYFSAKEGAEINLTGSQRMQERPIGILVNALKSLGADIEYLKNEGFPPLKITGKKLQKEEVKIKADVSSQYISALMLIAPMLPNGLKISLEGKTTSVPYIEMTLSLLKHIGIKGNFSKSSITISSAENVNDKLMIVESDWSSASYFYSLVALSDDLQITLSSFSAESLQGDSALVQIYDSLGVQTIFDSSEGTISLSKKKTELPDSLLLDLSNTPDLAQTIAVTCFGLGISCKLSGLHTLKIKETDRLLALKNELEKLGATIQVDDNSLSLEKATKINSNTSIETYQDHRMAMAFAPLALKTELTINNAEVVSKSYPNFWEDIQKMGIGLELISR